MSWKLYDQSAVDAWFPPEAADIEKRLQIAAGAFFISLVTSRFSGQALHSALLCAGIAFLAGTRATYARIFFSYEGQWIWVRMIFRLIWVGAVIFSLASLVLAGWNLLAGLSS